MANKDVALLMMLSALKRELRAHTYATLATCGRADSHDVANQHELADTNEQDALAKGGVFDGVAAIVAKVE